MLERDGRIWFRKALAEDACRSLDVACTLGDAPGQRLLLETPASLNNLAQGLLPGARPVRVVVFNKSETTNWTLPWHQDRVIALRGHVETPGFTNWTNKAGIWHAEPRIELLERMIFARIHLDAADEQNGCLQLALGTHPRGKIAAEDAEAIANASPIENCIAERGDVLFAKMLTLHRSSPSRTSAARRAIRVDYCAEPLPPPLEWVA